MIIENITVIDKALICALLMREISELTIKQYVHGSSGDINYALRNLNIALEKVSAAKP